MGGFHKIFHVHVVRRKIIEPSMFFIVLPAWEGTWGLSPLLLEVLLWLWFLTSHVESPVVNLKLIKTDLRMAG